MAQMKYMGGKGGGVPHDNNCISVQDKDQASREVQGEGKCSDD